MTQGSGVDRATGGQVFTPTDDMYCKTTVSTTLLDPTQAGANPATRFIVQDVGSGVITAHGPYGINPRTESGELLNTATQVAAFALLSGADYRFGCEVTDVPGVTNYDCQYSFVCVKQTDVVGWSFL